MPVCLTHLYSSGFQPTAQRVNADAKLLGHLFAGPSLLCHHPHSPCPERLIIARRRCSLFAVFVVCFHLLCLPSFPLYLVSFCPSIREGGSIEQSYLTADSKGDSPNDESFNIPTSDGKTVRVNLEFSYRFDEDRVAETFTLFKGKSGEEIKNTFIKPKIIAWTQEVSANYPVTDIFGDKRTEINAELDVYLRDKFDKYGIIIDTVNFTDISVDAETAAAIQKKVNAQQELELANIEAQTAKVQAEKDKEVAQIAAEKAIIEAEAKAEATRIAAEAEADANAQIAASLTPELIDKIMYEKWNGELPTVSGSNAIVSMEGLK